MSRFLACRQNNSPLLHGTQVMAAMNAFAYMPPLEWAECMRKLNDELENRLKQKDFAAKANRPRILVTGSPIMYPNLKIPLLIEEMGGMLAAALSGGWYLPERYSLHHGNRVQKGAKEMKQETFLVSEYCALWGRR